MKQLSLCCAVGMLLVSGHAYANPKISGTIKAIVQEDTLYVEERNKTTNTVLKDESSGRAEMKGSSRLKFSGSHKLNDVLTASYSLEYEFGIDSARANSGTEFRPRSTYVSLDHKQYGRIRAGRMTNPENDFDVGVTNGDNWAALHPFSSFGERANNAIQYYSPYFGKDKKTRIKLHYGMDENSSADTRFNTYYNIVDRQEVRRDVATAQIANNGKTFGWGLAYTQAGSDYNAIAGMVRYNPNAKLGLGLTLRQTDYNGQEKEKSIFTGASYSLEKDMRVYGQFGYSDGFTGRKGYDLTIAALGVSKEYKVGSGRALIFGEVAGERYQKNRTNSSGHSVVTNEDTLGWGTGIVYKF